MQVNADGRQGQRPMRDGKSVHKVQQVNQHYPIEQEQDYRSLYSINIKYLSFDHVKSVIFTKLDSRTSQKGVCIT